MALLGLSRVSTRARQLPLPLIQLPARFQISLYTGVADTCCLQLPPAAELCVGICSASKAYALADHDGDGRTEQLYWYQMIKPG